MDPTKLLKRQHREVQSLFKQMERTDEGRRRRQLMDQIVQSLQLHMRIEEEIFYPAVREIGTRKAEEMALEAHEEHAVAKLVMEQIPEVDPDDERFEAKMTVFRELLEHHIEEEEEEMFKIAAKIGDDELEELGNRMMEEVSAAEGETAPTRRGQGNGRQRRAMVSR